MRSRLRRGRFGGRAGSGGGGKDLAQPPHHRGFHGGGGALHELADLIELGEYDLALEPELLGEFVDAGLACHVSPSLACGFRVRATSLLRHGDPHD
jgi:hypothetical protein